MREYLEKTFDQNLDRYLDEWKTLLRFPSISTEPQYDSDCAACAEWLRDRLARMGFDSKLVQTPGKPVVFAERPGQPQRPRVLFSGRARRLNRPSGTAASTRAAPKTTRASISTCSRPSRRSSPGMRCTAPSRSSSKARRNPAAAG